MTLTIADLPLSRAAQLLDQVHAALLRADYAALPAMTAALEEELAARAPWSEPQMAVIRGKATRNGACLIAAQRGVKAARRRLAEIRTAAAGLVTYDRKGRRAEVIESRKLAQRL